MFAQAVIVGAGPAGLAVAQQMQSRGLRPLLLEKADQVGSTWRRHYDRLHLHTPRLQSSLPGLAIPGSYGRYPSRKKFVEYLETYAAQFDLKPRFSTPVGAIRREGRQFAVETPVTTIKTPIVVVATGWADFPDLPRWAGMDDFRGQILHSSAYGNSEPFRRSRALVIGFGNSGAEIALDLAEAGAEVTISQRSPVRVAPRDLLGVPIVYFALAERFLPTRMADAINAPLLRLAVGSLETLGFQTAAIGSVEKDRRIPVLDIGAMKLIREGRIKVRGAIRAFTRTGVVFADGPEEAFDVVVLATGFKPDLRGLLPDARGVLDGEGRPLVSDRATAEPGLYFVGALAAPTGQLREIRLGATRIASLARSFLRDEGGLAAV